MGTINYGTSDYITIGLEPYDFDSYTTHNGEEFYCPCCGEYVTVEYDTARCDNCGWSAFDSDLDELMGEGKTDYQARQDDMEADRENVERIRAKYDFFHYRVEVKPGYYEGFYIDIEEMFGCEFDNSEAKRETQKEITQIKLFLLECVEAGCVQCFPGWCTGYASRERTLEGIKEAVKAMREEVRKTPTWYTCERNGNLL